MSSNSFVSPAASSRFFRFFFPLDLHHLINYHSTEDGRSVGPLFTGLLLNVVRRLWLAASESLPLTPPLCEWGVHGSQFAERLVLLLRGKRWTLRCLER